MTAAIAPYGILGVLLHAVPLVAGAGIALVVASRQARRTCAEARLPRAPQRKPIVVEPYPQPALPVEQDVALSAYDRWRLAEDELKLAYEEWSAHPRDHDLWLRYRVTLSREEHLAQRYAEATA